MNTIQHLSPSYLFDVSVDETYQDGQIVNGMTLKRISADSGVIELDRLYRKHRDDEKERELYVCVETFGAIFDAQRLLKSKVQLNLGENTNFYSFPQSRKCFKNNNDVYFSVVIKSHYWSVLFEISVLLGIKHLSTVDKGA